MAGAGSNTQSTRRRTIYAKIESTPGTANPPNASSDAILCRSIDVVPLVSETVDRELIRASFGNFAALVVNEQTTVTIEVDFRNSPAATVVPEIDPLIRACAYDGIFRGASDAIRYESTGSGSDTVYTLPSAEAGSDQAITYKPTSGARVAKGASAPDLANAPSPGFCSCTIDVYADSKRHRMVGCMGTMDFVLDSSGIPTMTFTMTGTYAEPTDENRPSGTAGNRLPVPLIVNNDNTALTFPNTINPRMYNFNFTTGNEVVRAPVVGAATETRITDRRSSGSLEIQSSSVTANNPWPLFGKGTSVDLAIRHGPATGKRIDINAPRCTLEPPTYGDRDNIETLVIPIRVVPSTVGNDELTLTYRGKT